MSEKTNIDSLSSSRKIEWAVRALAGVNGLKQPKFAEGTVKSVDEDNRTCTVEITLGEMPETMEDVHLQADNGDGFIKIPKIDSSVQILLMPDNEAYVYMTSDLEAIVIFIDAQNKVRIDSTGFVINDGTNQGVINIIQLTTALNTLVTQVTTNLTLISAAITGLGGTYVASPLSAFVKANYEDTKVKH